MMKKVLFLLVLGFTTVFVGCGSDDDESSIVGAWEITQFTTTGCDNSDDNISLDFSDGNCFEEDGFELCVEIEFEFKADGTMKVKMTSVIFGTQTTETENYNYNVSGNSITVCENNNECSTETFTLNGDTLTFKFSDVDGCTVTLTAKRK